MEMLLLVITDMRQELTALRGGMDFLRGRLEQEPSAPMSYPLGTSPNSFTTVQIQKNGSGCILSFS